MQYSSLFNNKNILFELQNSLNINSIDYEEIYPNIIVYKNLYSNIKELFDKILFSKKNSKGDFIFEKWREWFTFGDYVSTIPNRNGNHDDPNFLKNVPQADVPKVHEAEYYCYKNIYEASQLSLIHYVKYFNVNIPENSQITQPNIARYSSRNYLSKQKKYRPGDLAMEFHTDYPISEWYWPGRKFLLTCNTYINDNYLGGEIIFMHGNKIVPYKPVAGDVIVFPSGSPLFPIVPERKPYFHAVAIPCNNDKYFVRTYIQYEEGITNEWEIRKKSFPDEDSFNKFLDQESKNGMNIAEAFLGNKKLDSNKEFYEPDEDCRGFNLLDYNLGENFWTRVDKKVFDLYDIDKDFYELRRDKF
jgi:hypothetical protein